MTSWHEDLLDVAIEGDGIHGAVQQHGGVQAGKREGSHQREVFRVVAWRTARRSFSSRGPTIAASKRDVGAGLVNEDQAPRIQVAYDAVPDAALCLVPLAGTHRPFFRVKSNRRMARLIVLGLTRTPCSVSQRAQCSSR